MKNIAIRLFDFFSSLKLAVILILSLAIMLAIGTFYEAEHGTADAQRVIYKSVFMTAEMFLLIVNLACAAIDRLPWKKYHAGFVITHAGIIILIMGSFITQQRGIDGSLALGVDETADTFLIPETRLQVYQTIGGKPFGLLHQQSVDFDRRPPGKYPYEFKLVDNDTLKVTGYVQKGIRQTDVKASDDTATLPAVQFSIYNERVHVKEWLGLDANQLPPFYDLGPAVISFIRGPIPQQPEPRNQILVRQDPTSGILHYAVFSMRQKEPTAQGLVKVGDEVATGWMNLKFKVEKFIPHGVVDMSYTESPAGSPDTNTTPAIQAQIGNKKAWFELGMPHEIKGDKSGYFVNFTRERIDLGFQLKLNRFKMKTYGGSALPMSYESTVTVNGKGSKVIEMNEPLKFNSFTLYQSSYETNERGEPVISVFSVNYDPGRAIKYLGALSIVLGIATMFYLKPRYTRKKRVVS